MLQYRHCTMPFSQIYKQRLTKKASHLQSLQWDAFWLALVIKTIVTIMEMT